MKTIKQLGIYIDYTNAFLMELINKMIVSRIIEFENNIEIEKYQDNFIKPEIDKENQHHLRSAYYLELCDIIRNYNQVVLFGPNDAKNELFNLLKFDHNFDSIKINNGNSDNLTEIQMHDYVKMYYK
jgi:ADP-heptose:LPS heptosyltransferase